MHQGDLDDAALLAEEMYQRLGDTRSAVVAYEMARLRAESVGYESVAGRAPEALESLKDGVQ